MNKRTFARIGITSGTALLCLGVAGPALACTVPTEMDRPTLMVAKNPLPAAIARADRSITSQLNKLSTWATKITNDPNLTTTQKAAMAATIASAQAQLQAQKVQIDAATSLTELKTELHSAAVSAANAAVGLDLAIVHADDAIAAERSGFTTFAARLAADPNLTAPQKADLAAKIAAVQAALAVELANVNAAATPTDVNMDLHSAAVRSAITAVSLSLAIARADNEIAAVQAKLTTWANQLAADPNLSPDQKTHLAAKIAAEQASLTTLMTKVDSATSASQVNSILQAAHFFGQSWKGDDPSKQPKYTPVPVKPSPTMTINPATTLVAVKPAGHETTTPKSSSHSSSAHSTSKSHSHETRGRHSHR
jgi:hypothetical protein